MNEFLFPELVKPPKDIYFAPCPYCHGAELLVSPYKIKCSNCNNDFYFVMPAENFNFQTIKEAAEAWSHFLAIFDIKKKDA
jgi:hypothetical protein